MKITDIISEDTIAIGLEVDNKDTLLGKMLELAGNSGKITDLEEVKKEIYKREDIMSTGVGKGIALPHAKTNSVTDSTGALAILKEGIDFNSLDEEFVNIVFLILGREDNVGNHLRLLSKISRMLNSDSFRMQLRKSKTPEEAFKLFKEIEDNE